MKLFHALVGFTLFCLTLSACAPPPPPPSENHLLNATLPPAGGDDPSHVPEAQRLSEEHGAPAAAEGPGLTIQVTDMPVKDLLFSLARDANMNIDIYPGIKGRVTLSAVNQSLPQILDRISRQVNLRYELKDGQVTISPDRPYLHIYQVNYVNIARTSLGTIRVSTHMAGDNRTGLDAKNASYSYDNRNETSSDLTNVSKNEFWQSLTQNVNMILEAHYTPFDGEEEDTGLLESATEEILAPMELTPPGEPAPPAADGNKEKKSAGDAAKGKKPTRPAILAINQETGLISIYANFRQHREVQEFLDKLMESAHRQVLIESTVVEVSLNDQYQQGVDWSKMILAAKKFGIKAISPTTTASDALSFWTLDYANTRQKWRTPISGGPALREALEVALEAMEEFGSIKVLSSPKIMTLNNQPAILKVVNNEVYFTIETNTVQYNSNVDTNRYPAIAYTTHPHTVPVGLVMTVTPHIAENDMVSLIVRPSVTRIIGYKQDPNPALKKGGIWELEEDVVSEVPEIQVREMESLLRIHSGQVAVMGGLMEDRNEQNTDGVRGLARAPIVGNLFSVEERKTRKVELVVFLKPLVMTNGAPKATGNGVVTTAPSVAPMTSQPALPNPGPAQDSYLDFSGSPKPAPLQLEGAGPNVTNRNNAQSGRDNPGSTPQTTPAGSPVATTPPPVLNFTNGQNAQGNPQSDPGDPGVRKVFLSKP